MMKVHTSQRTSMIPLWILRFFRAPTLPGDELWPLYESSNPRMLHLGPTNVVTNVSKSRQRCQTLRQLLYGTRGTLQNAPL